MPSKSDTHRRSGIYETQNSTTVSNNCAQDRERYGILWQSSVPGPRVVTRLIVSKENYVFTVYLLCVCWPLSSPDGSYTEEQNSETQVKVNITPNPNPNPVPTSTTPEFDDEFDDEETLPTIGTCKALYPFEGNSNNMFEIKHINPIDGPVYLLFIWKYEACSLIGWLLLVRSCYFWKHIEQGSGFFGCRVEEFHLISSEWRGVGV